MQPATAAVPQPSHTASFVREVLNRLTAFKLPPTPENFAWVYRQLQREHNLPGAADYVNDLAILEHAINAFDQLFIADDWLNAKLAELRELLGSTSLPDEKKRIQAKAHLEEIVCRKEELLYHLAESSLALKSSITDVVKEIGKLSTSMGGFSTNLAKYQELVENCHDVQDARRVLLMVGTDVKKLNDALVVHEQTVTQNFWKIQESGGQLLGTLSYAPSIKPPQGASNASTASDLKHAISTAALRSEELLRRVTEPEFKSAVLLLVELAEGQAGELSVKRFSELLAARTDPSIMLGYWGAAQFVFVMPNAGPARALMLARELGHDVSKAAREAPGRSLAFSYGIASYVDNDSEAQPFYKAFELAFENLRPLK